MIVDDSAIVRGMLNRRLSEQPDFIIVGSAGDGLRAIEEVRTTPADVVILDLEMPRMDGFAALPEIRRLLPQAKIIISSTLTERNADVALRALAIGANDYLTKPSTRQNRGEADRFYIEMIEKIRALTNRPAPSIAAKQVLTSPVPTPATATPAKPKLNPGASPFSDGLAVSPIQLLPAQRPHALAIASSTGGPQALLQIFTDIRQSLDEIPIFITQHMPSTFTALMAKHIQQASGTDCREAVADEVVIPGRVYIAPGDFHMRVQKSGTVSHIRLNQEPPINYCRPAADPMIESLVEIYGSRLLLLVLTGMGQDGMVGAQLVMKAGGTVIAQDKASSTVWGMPKAVAEHGYCKGLLPLNGFGHYLKLIFTGGADASR